MTSAKIDIEGYDFSKGHSFENVIPFLKSTGIQSSQLAKAIEILHKIVDIRVKNLEMNKQDPESNKCQIKIICGFTSNMCSSGMREFQKYLVKNKFVDALVTTTGALEEDIMKCLSPHYVYDFVVNDREWRKNGMNRIGNMMVPNDNYCKFDDFFENCLNEMHDKQDKEKYTWTPSKIIAKLGEKVNDEDSVFYWCWKNDIPVFSPAITDGAIGDHVFFHSYQRAGLIIDVNEDYIKLCDFYKNCEQRAGLIFGGGTVKHHVQNSSKHHGGMDYTVVISTSESFDASESGAPLEEEVGKGKIKSAKSSEYVKISCESSIVIPILIAETFGKRRNELQGLK